MFLIDSETRTAKLLDNGTARFNTTTIRQVGKAVAKILELPISANSGEASLKKYANKQVYIASFLTSQRELLSAVQKVTGTSDSDWSIREVSSKKFMQEGKERVAKGDFMDMAGWLYGCIMSQGNGGDYEEKLMNGVLRLESGDLEVAVKEALKA